MLNHSVPVRWRQRTVQSIGTLFLTYALLLGSLLPAQAALPDDPDAIQAQSDDSVLEVGVYYVVDYTQSGCPQLDDLPATSPDALGLVSQLQSFSYGTPRWTKRFAYGSTSAWEEDWKASGFLGILGGKENDYIDTVDLAYFAGHGSSSGFFFGDCTHDDNKLTPIEAYDSWGDKDLDWVALAACNVLDDSFLNLSLGNWNSTLDGARLILGFKTVMDDVPHGVEFGRYIRYGYTLPQAWFKAADKLQSQGKVARVLAAESAYFNDRSGNHNSSSVDDGDYYWQTHTVGSEPARQVNLRLATEMPILQIAPLPLSEADNRFSTLGSAFGSTTANAVSAAAIGGSDTITQTADAKLEMDYNSGLYIYMDTDRLWTEQAFVSAANAEGMLALTADDARTIADNFLTQNNLMPGDAQYYEVTTDTVTEAFSADPEDDGLLDVTGATVLTDTIVSETVTNYNVVYSRIISYTNPVTPTEVTEFSVMGPGSKMKVYVAPQVRAGVSAAALQSEAILGGVGGYRAIIDPEVRAAEVGAVETVPVMPEATVETLFEKLESQVSLSFVAQPLATKEILSKTLAYWEGPMGFGQTELIPVYALTVRSTLDDGTVNEYEVYIPVDKSYLPPYIDISEPSAPVVGDESTAVTLQAADASQTLAALGVDDTLDFAMGVGPFEYRWYLNEATFENELQNGQDGATISADGRTLDFSLSNTDDSIVLVVTDMGKFAEPRTSQTSYQLAEGPRTTSFDPGNNLLLPFVVQ